MRASTCSYPLLLALTGCFGLDTTPQKDVLTDDTSDTGPVTVGALTADRTSIDFGTVEPGSEASEAIVLTNVLFCWRLWN